VGVDCGCQIGGVVGGSSAGNDNNEGAQWVGPSKELDSGEGTEEPRQSGGGRVGEAGSGKSEVDTVDGGQNEIMVIRSRSMVWEWSRKASVLMHGTTEVG